ncbi:aspartate kinase [Ornithinibacillus massiliensis]|uniref:Aspartokinase n=1 Tax=Ornithinibacillus massiliensis TaxID=1944633 RepID=A0ABS5MGL8_9BACI|nr:aspartate kinase [Ornithinibacillus massiliensis]MBS3681247.1 aspartate kinase [Ornithinibacillus massiliensis]
MKRNVLKFGGTSVSSLEKIKGIAGYLKDRVRQGEQLVVVVSAMGKTTDELLEQVSMITQSPNEQDLAVLLTTGEQQTISYLSIILNDLGVKSKPLTGYQAGIETVGHHLKSKISKINTKLFEQLFETYDVLIVAGFQGFNTDNEITTLGRGGSDTTAVALAAAIQCPCEIYTDVAGVYSTDPRIYPNAKRLQVVSYEEMMEMSALGSGVLVSRSVEIAKNFNIPIYLGKTLSDEKGTWVMSTVEMIEKKAVTGVAIDQDMIHVTLNYPENDIHLLDRVFIHLEQEEVNVDMISQITNNEGLQLSFTMKDTEEYQIQKIFSHLKEDYPELYFKIENQFAKVSVIGSGMRDMTGVASKVFRTLIESDIPFYQVTTSEISISYVVDIENGEKAVQLLCKSFDL